MRAMSSIFQRVTISPPAVLAAGQSYQAGQASSDARTPSARTPAPRAWGIKYPPSTWAGVLMGMLPFFIFGSAYLIQAASELGRLPGWLDGLVSTGPLIAYGLISSGLILGWIMGFPRWSLAYLGMGLYFGYATSQQQIHGMRYGLMGWLPLLTGLVVGLLMSRSFFPLVRLFSSLLKDWTRLSFGIYAYLLPLMTIIFFDSDWGEAEYQGLVFDTLLLAAGAAVFLRSRTTWQRAVSLQVVMLVMLVRGVLMGEWLGGLDNLGTIQRPGLVLFFLLWGGLMFVPALIGLLRQILQRSNLT